jgi:DNA topoisomerase-1
MARSSAALRELGADPASGQPVSVKDGRFGPYVTDGITNASLRKGDTVEGVTLERAAELLANRREAAPRPARARKVGGAKKAPVKKAVAKKTAGTVKKAAAKKTVAKKPAGGAKKSARKAPRTP